MSGGTKCTDFPEKFWGIGPKEVARRPPALKVSAWVPSITVHSHFKHCGGVRLVSLMTNVVGQHCVTKETYNGLYYCQVLNPPIFTHDSCTPRYYWERVLAMGILSVRFGVTTRYRITADELSGGTNINDLERPWIPKIWVFSEFFAISGCNTHFNSELRRNHSR